VSCRYAATIQLRCPVLVSHHSAGRERQHNSRASASASGQLVVGGNQIAHHRRRAPESKLTSARKMSDRTETCLLLCSLPFAFMRSALWRGRRNSPVSGCNPSLTASNCSRVTLSTQTQQFRALAMPIHLGTVRRAHRNSRCVPDAVEHIQHHPSWPAKSAQPNANPVSNPNATAGSHYTLLKTIRCRNRRAHPTNPHDIRADMRMQ